MVKIFVILPFFFLSVDALCNFPCNEQVKGKFRGALGTFEFSCKNSSLIVRTVGFKKELQECYARSGPFTLLRRNGDEYQCVKEAAVHDQITWIYETDFIKMKYPPTLCSLCSPRMMRPRVYAAAGAKWKCAKKLKPPPIGCNRPHNCPISDIDDVPCLGCEPYDDGTCCAGCGVRLPAPEKWPVAYAEAHASVMYNPPYVPMYGPYVPSWHKGK